MRISFVHLIIALLAMLLVACVSVPAWYVLSIAAERRIEDWENRGVECLGWIHLVFVSDLEWDAKERALYAIEKILDPSSLRYMVDQLYYGNLWRQFWDGSEYYQAFRQNVMYSMRLYGNDALPVLVQEVEAKGHRVSDLAIWGIGLLKTEPARRVLEEMSQDPYWKPKGKAIEEALRLWNQPQSPMQKHTLQPEEVDEELAKLAAAAETGMGALEEMSFHAVINSLGSMKIERSREALRRIAERFPGRFVQTASIRALGMIGSTEDVSFVCGYVFDRDIDVRQEAIVALGEMGAESAIPLLEQVLELTHEAPRNKRLAQEAIQMIIHRD